MAVLSTGLAGAQQRAINYTRQFELEADRVGMTTLARAGYDPEGAPRFFGRFSGSLPLCNAVTTVFNDSPIA